MNRTSALASMLAAALLSGACPTIAAQPGNLDRELASEPATVTTRSGRRFQGLLDGWQDGRLAIRAATDGGEVGYSFATDGIARIEMPGEDVVTRGLDLLERGNTVEALPLLEAITRQRLRYLSILDGEQRKPMLACIRARATAADPWVTIGFARAMRDSVDTPGEQQILRNAVLRAHVRLGLKEETRRLANEWCEETERENDSVLGWAVLARLAYDEAGYEECLWVALQPVAFAHDANPEELDTCYALAVAAAQALGRTQHAATLRKEMSERGLDWPEHDDLAPAAILDGPGRSSTPAPTADTPSAPTSQDSPDAIDSIRKLVGGPSP